MYRFSERISSLQPSAIREILKVTQDPEVISFAAGNPASESFPAKEMKQIADELFERQAATALQYGISEGYAPLRELTAKRIKEKFNIGREFDGTIIVTGGQQGIELTAKVLCNEGDTVICEAPSFIGALNAFRSYNLNLVGVGMDEQGIDLDHLEHALRANPRTKILYLIPTFQNPSGSTMSLERRQKILELSARHNVMILEDNPYYELRYSGETVPTIKSMDTEGRVIHVGSYSKLIAPGIRLGYVCAPEPVIAKLTVAKQVSDVHTNLFFQMIVAEYLRQYDLDAHVAGVCKLYRARRDRMAAAIDAHCGGKMTYTLPDGGLFLWGRLPEGYDGMELCRLTGAKKVAAVPGSAFSVDESQVVPAVRLNFSLPDEQTIDRGMEILGECVREYCK